MSLYMIHDWTKFHHAPWSYPCSRMMSGLRCRCICLWEKDRPVKTIRRATTTSNLIILMVRASAITAGDPSFLPSFPRFPCLAHLTCYQTSGARRKRLLLWLPPTDCLASRKQFVNKYYYSHFCSLLFTTRRVQETFVDNFSVLCLGVCLLCLRVSQ